MTLRIFHTGDWHLGRMLYGHSLLEDQAHFIEEVLLPDVAALRPDLVIIAGDIYDRQIAPVEAIRLFDRTLERLIDSGTAVAVISGNHDSGDRLALMKGLLRRMGVYMATDLQDAMDPVTLSANGEKLRLFLLPFFDHAQARAFFGDESLKGETACMNRALAALRPKATPDAVNLLVSHCTVTGARVSDSEAPLSIGGVNEVSPDLFAAFDYVALGHIHRPQRAGAGARYAGTPLKYSVSEADDKKSYVQLDIVGGKLRTQCRAITPLRDLRRITGPFQEILAQGQETPCRDYVEIHLTDPHPVLMAAQRLLPFYPKLLALRNPWAATTADDQALRPPKDASDQALFAHFMADLCGNPPSQDDLNLFSELF